MLELKLTDISIMNHCCPYFLVSGQSIHTAVFLAKYQEYFVTEMYVLSKRDSAGFQLKTDFWQITVIGTYPATPFSPSNVSDHIKREGMC